MNSAKQFAWNIPVPLMPGRSGSSPGTITWCMCSAGRRPARPLTMSGPWRLDNPCARVRNYEADDLVEGVKLVGSAFIHERVKEGAALLSF